MFATNGPKQKQGIIWSGWRTARMFWSWCLEASHLPKSALKCNVTPSIIRWNKRKLSTVPNGRGWQVRRRRRAEMKKWNLLSFYNFDLLIIPYINLTFLQQHVHDWCHGPTPRRGQTAASTSQVGTLIINTWKARSPRLTTKGWRDYVDPFTAPPCLLLTHPH